VTWRAKVFFERRVIAQKSFTRRVDAKRWEADQLAKLDAGSWIDPTRGRSTFAALAEEWQASRGHLAVRSQETTRFLLDKDVIPEIGAFPIAAISAADVHDLSSTKGCLPEPTNRIDLGYLASCTGAVAAAKTYYSDVNGCYWCARDCHTT
jgi:hypothetical protein